MSDFIKIAAHCFLYTIIVGIALTINSLLLGPTHKILGDGLLAQVVLLMSSSVLAVLFLVLLIIAFAIARVLFYMVQGVFKERWWVAFHHTRKGVPLLIKTRFPWRPFMLFFSISGPYITAVGAKAKMRQMLLSQGETINDIDTYLDRI